MSNFILSDWLEAIKYYDTKKEVKEILGFCKFPNKTVLEVGCGTGRLTVFIADVANKIVAIDPWKEAIEYAESEMKKENIEYEVFNGENIPYPDRSFDVVMSSWSLHHAKDYIKVLKEMVRVLKKDGQLFLIEPVAYSDHDQIDSNFKSRIGVKIETLEKFWIDILLYLNNIDMKLQSKIIVAQNKFPNMETAIKTILVGEDEKIKNNPQSKIFLKEILSDFTKNNSVIYTDSALLISGRM